MKVNLSSHWMVYRSIVVIALLVQLLLLNGSIVQPAELDHAVAPSEESQAEISDLPQPLQYAISRDLGRDQPAYHFSAQPDSSYLANEPRSGLRARLQPGKLQVNAGEHSWSLNLNALGRGQVLESLPAVSSEQLDANRLSFSRGGLTEWYRNGPLGLQQGWNLGEPPGGVGNEPLTLSFTQGGSLLGVTNAGKDSLILADQSGVVLLSYGGLLAYDAEQQPLPAWFEVQGEKVVVRVEDAQATYPVTIDPWLQATKLTTSQDDLRGQYVGYSVAISADGTTVVVGNDYMAPDSQPDEVYVYTRGESWASTPLYTARLTGSDVDDTDGFGSDIAIDDNADLIVVGAPGFGFSRGAIYVFERPAEGWVDASETARLISSDGQEGDGFGISLALSADGSTLAAGASGIYFGGENRGAVYVYERPGDKWISTSIYEARLTASDGENGDHLGRSIALSADGGTLAAGAPDHPGGDGRGAVYVYERSVEGWESAVQNAKLTASDGENEDHLGRSMALSADGGTLAAGAPDHPGGDGRGAVYVYERPGEKWISTSSFEAKLTASDGEENDYLGLSMALSSDGATLAVGTPTDELIGLRTSAVYMYERPLGGWLTSIESAKLTASDGVDSLGYSVALSANGSTLAAGAPWNNPVVSGVYLYERTSDSWMTGTEDAKLTANDGADNDKLGRSVALSASGETVAAGARYNDVGGDDRGAAYVYTRPLGGWPGSAVFSAKLTASDGQDKDYLGWSVALSADGGTLAVGAPYEDGAVDHRGAVYVYERPSAGWTTATQSAKLTASDAEYGDHLGYSVALSADGGTLAAGAPYQNLGGSNRGAVYLFERQDEGWANASEDAKLTAKGGVDNDFLGASVSLSSSGGVLAAGAPEYDAGGEDRGAVYIFLQPEGGWANIPQHARLTASDGGDDDELGYAVSLSADGNTLVVGAPYHPAGDAERGAVYVFEQPIDEWVDATETARLTDSDSENDELLGWSVAVDSYGETIVAGAQKNAAGGSDRGAVYLYARPQDGWANTSIFTTKLTASDGLDNDRFGYAVALNASGDTLVAGAPFQDVITWGISRGAAYVFISLTAPAFTSDAPPTPATVGTAYAFTFTARGNPPPVFDLAAGSLPPGLTLEASTGLLSGVLTTAGGYNFTVSAANGVEPAASQVVTLDVEKDQELMFLPLVISGTPE